MRGGELAANLTFWMATPASIWWLAARCDWGWVAAAAGGLGLGIAAALVIAFLRGFCRDN